MQHPKGSGPPYTKNYLREGRGGGTTVQRLVCHWDGPIPPPPSLPRGVAFVPINRVTIQQTATLFVRYNRLSGIGSDGKRTSGISKYSIFSASSQSRISSYRIECNFVFRCFRFFFSLLSFFFFDTKYCVEVSTVNYRYEYRLSHIVCIGFFSFVSSHFDIHHHRWGTRRALSLNSITTATTSQSVHLLPASMIQQRPLYAMNSRADYNSSIAPTKKMHCFLL